MLKKVWFLKEAFLLANTSIKMIVRMLFLIVLDANNPFVEKKLIWRSYKTAKVLLTTKRVELIDKKEFATMAIDENSETFIVYIAFIMENMLIHLVEEAQITTL